MNSCCTVDDAFFWNKFAAPFVSNFLLKSTPLNRPFRFPLRSYFEAVFDAIKHNDSSLVIHLEGWGFSSCEISNGMITRRPGCRRCGIAGRWGDNESDANGGDTNGGKLVTSSRVVPSSYKHGI